MVEIANLPEMNPDQLRELAQQLIAQLASKDTLIAQQTNELSWRQSKIDKLTQELALYKRWKFGAKAKSLSAEQIKLFEETCAADIAAIEQEIEKLGPPVKETEKRQAKRASIPPHLPRTEIHHEPESKTCHCGCALKRIGEDVSEKLDYTPGVISVEKHIRGKWVCDQCETLIQAPVPAQVIDKGLPTAGMLAHVMIAKFADHIPLYRLSGILERDSQLRIPPSTLGQWVGETGAGLQPVVDAFKSTLLGQRVLHADETPVAMLDPGAGKTKRAYVWSYCSTAYAEIQGVVYDFAESRDGQHAKDFLGEWKGILVCDNYSGYKRLLTQGIVDAGCLAHSRRKFFDLYANHQSQIAEAALPFYSHLYQIEKRAMDLTADERRQLRQRESQPIADALLAWMVAQRKLVPNGSAIAKAIDYSVNRWEALMRFLDDGDIPIDNNWNENRIRPIAVGRSNWLFAGSLRAGQRAAAIMSLIQSAKLNGHDPHAYLKDVLTRLPTQPASRIEELLPHLWQNSATR
jgi:transposase